MSRTSCAVAMRICVAFLVLGYVTCDKTTKYNEETGKKFLVKLNNEMSKLNTENTLASWEYESNLTDYNLEHQLEVSAKVARHSKEIWEEVIKYPWQDFKDPDTKRQFQKYAYLGSDALSPEKYERLEKIVKDMQGIYAKAKICDYCNASRCSLHLEPEITELFAASRNPKELKHLWTEWRKASGKRVRKMFKEYVELSNEAARLNNYTDASESWLKDYESEDFIDQIEELWQQVRPLYEQLHAYVRRRLREVYGEEVVSKTGPIPAHLLGNLWAQTWSNILNETLPYPEKPSTDVSEEMIKQKYTPLKMFKTAEEFFTSIGLSPMPETFWKNSIIEKPTDGRDLVCHASAWDFYDGKDFRIKQCTRVNFEDLQTVHHEMGHIQYYLQYKNQPVVYKEGANPGFHEAVGDVMALSVTTAKHLNKIGLLKEVVDDQEAEINELFGMALDKVAFLPFAYLMDQWRWGVFQGKITESDYNRKWWEFREKYQGMQPPTRRSEKDFDPGAKYHIVASVPYIRYFVSFIIQFQFHRSLCIAAGEFDAENPTLKPLHKCDIYQNKAAGELLGNMLKMGSSKPWPDAMEAITGQRKMDAGALLQYFSGLQTWLERENARTGEYIGWEPSSNTNEADSMHYYEFEDPDDYFEDNFGYSYAELVRQNDNAFGSSNYRRQMESWMLHPNIRSSTEKQFETNRNDDWKFDAMARTSNVRNLIQRSNLQGTMSEKSFNLRLSNGVTESEKCPRLAGSKNVRDFSNTDPDITYNTNVVQTTEKQLQKIVSKPYSTLTKLLSSIGSSMPRPRVIDLCTQKNNYRSTEDAPINSDLMWKAEMMRVQAEKMLKSTDALGKWKSSLTGMTLDRNSAPACDNHFYFTPETKNFYRDELGRKSQFQLPNTSPLPLDDTLKKSVKKSFLHYHYNIRTPVVYNTVVVKKPPTNEWVDDDDSGKKMKFLYTTEEVPAELLRYNKIKNINYNEIPKFIKLVPVALERNRIRYGAGQSYRAQNAPCESDHMRRQRFYAANTSSRKSRLFVRNVRSGTNIKSHFQIYSCVKYSFEITKNSSYIVQIAPDQMLR